jgi:phage-related protein
MDEPPRKTPLVFYRTETGTEIVRDWLRGLEQADRNAIGQDLMRAQFRWPIGMPLCRPLGDGLWEVRSSLTSNRIARVLFCFVDGRLLALHGFIKKTQKTPDADLEIARKRMSEFKQQTKPNAPKRPKKKEAP